MKKVKVVNSTGTEIMAFPCDLAYFETIGFKPETKSSKGSKKESE